MGEGVYLQRTSWALNLFLGSRVSILRTRSLALSEILGQGSDSKSSLPRRICLKIPASVSERRKSYNIMENMWICSDNRIWWSENRYFTCPKWGDTTKQNVQNYPCTPHISFWTIAFLKYLWCNIIGASNNIREFVTWGNRNEQLASSVILVQGALRTSSNTRVKPSTI